MDMGGDLIIRIGDHPNVAAGLAEREYRVLLICADRQGVAMFRDWIKPGGTPDVLGHGGCRIEPERYHLYVAWACP